MHACCVQANAGEVAKVSNNIAASESGSSSSPSPPPSTYSPSSPSPSYSSPSSPYSSASTEGEDCLAFSRNGMQKIPLITTPSALSLLRAAYVFVAVKQSVFSLNVLFGSDFKLPDYIHIMQLPSSCVMLDEGSATACWTSLILDHALAGQVSYGGSGSAVSYSPPATSSSSYSSPPSSPYSPPYSPHSGTDYRGSDTRGSDPRGSDTRGSDPCGNGGCPPQPPR